MNDMTLHADFWSAIGFAFAVVCALSAAMWALFTLMLKQYNNGLNSRFTTLERLINDANINSNERLTKIENTQLTLERDIMALRVELPEKYVRREDAIRSEMTLHAKFDGLAARIDSVLRMKNNE